VKRRTGIECDGFDRSGALATASHIRPNRRTWNVPKYLDVHRDMKGVKLKDVAEAHAKDLKVQGKYGVNFQKYWLDETAGTIFCLSDAPNKEAISKAHREAHGLLPSETFEVQEGS
jgi:Nickel responsive protein SCO4226-like